MKAFLLACVLGLASLPAHAAEDEAARAARWQDLRHAVFGDRSLADGAGVVALEAPYRAEDAALVPITVTTEPAGNTAADKIKALYILVDGNPSPLAGVFHFGPLADPHMLKTRVRVDQYTLMHAVAETEDGRLFVAERFVKAAGGCSAPSLKDPKLAMSRMGQMRLRVEGEPGGEPAFGGGQAETVQLLVSHPNNNGMQVDQLTHNFVPARFIQDLDVTYGGQEVFKLDADISLSEDPAITFALVPPGPGTLDVKVEDSSKTTFEHTFPLLPNRS